MSVYHDFLISDPKNSHALRFGRIENYPNFDGSAPFDAFWLGGKHENDFRKKLGDSRNIGITFYMQVQVISKGHQKKVHFFEL